MSSHSSVTGSRPKRSSRLDSTEEVVPVPQCEKCGEIYMDTMGECPTCRKRKQRNFAIAALVLFGIAVGVVVIRILLM